VDCFRIAGYEDVNDADRLSQDPTFRLETDSRAVVRFYNKRGTAPTGTNATLYATL
jgi:hypothetical protein